MSFTRFFGRRIALSVADQTVSSLTNLGLAILVARAVGREDFGAFTLAFGTYILALLASRALASEPLVARYSDSPSDVWEEKAHAATGVALWVGTIVGSACVALGSLTAILFGGTFGSVLIALGVALPGLLLQDVWRWVFFARGNGIKALANDLVWALLLLCGVALLVTYGLHSVEWFVLMWGASAGAAALLGVLQARIRPRPTAALAWWHDEREIAGRYLVEFGAANGASQLALYAVGCIAGLAAVGSLRVAQLLLGPLNVLVMGIGLVAVPEGTKALRHSADRLLSVGRAVSVSLAAAALLWGSLVFLVPEELGTRLLQDAWAPAHALVLPVAIGLAGTGAAVGALVGLRSLVAADLSLQASLMTAPIIVAGAAVGAALGSSVGAAIGLAVALCCGAVVYWCQLLRALRRRGPQTSAIEMKGPVMSGV